MDGLTFESGCSNLSASINLFKLDQALITDATPANALPVRRNRFARAVGRLSTRQALVWCGTELLTEHGFQITSIDKVLKRVGAPKGSFYHFFKTKDEFGSAVIQNYVEYYARKMDGIFGDSSVTGITKLKNFVDNAKHGMTRFDFKRGCLIGNLGQELASLDDQFRAQLEAVLVSWEVRVAACLQEAIDSAEISVTNDAQALSRFFWIGWEGAILRAKLMQNLSPIDQFTDVFFSKVAV